jgi:hypothetical protein
MYCPKCGTQNPEDAKVCLSCSQPLSALSQAPQTGAKTSALAIWSFVLALIGLYNLLLDKDGEHASWELTVKRSHTILQAGTIESKTSQQCAHPP